MHGGVAGVLSLVGLVVGTIVVLLAHLIPKRNKRAD